MTRHIITATVTVLASALIVWALDYLVGGNDCIDNCNVTTGGYVRHVN